MKKMSTRKTKGAKTINDDDIYVEFDKKHKISSN